MQLCAAKADAFCIVMGDFNFNEFERANCVFAAIYFIPYVFFLFFMLYQHVHRHHQLHVRRRPIPLRCHRIFSAGASCFRNWCTLFRCVTGNRARGGRTDNGRSGTRRTIQLRPLSRYRTHVAYWEALDKVIYLRAARFTRRQCERDAHFERRR